MSGKLILAGGLAMVRVLTDKDIHPVVATSVHACRNYIGVILGLYSGYMIEDSLDMCVCDVGVYVCLVKQTTYGMSWDILFRYHGSLGHAVQ